MSLRSAALSFLGGITGKKCVMKGGRGREKAVVFLVRNLKKLAGLPASRRGDTWTLIKAYGMLLFGRFDQTSL